MARGLLLLCVAVLLVGGGCLPWQGQDDEVEYAKVVKVIDGDTIRIEDGTRVRYLGIDAPEAGESMYREATQRNSELVMGQTVELRQGLVNVDKYGRLLRYVYIDGVFVNAILVEEGLAETMIYDEAERHAFLLRKLEIEARKEDRGMWGKD